MLGECLITSCCCLYIESMYKNTVSQERDEGAVVVRVSEGKEGKKEARLAIKAASEKGERVLIFPSGDLLATWRLRLAALA